MNDIEIVNDTPVQYWSRECRQGGWGEIKVCRIHNCTDEYETHALVALQTLRVIQERDDAQNHALQQLLQEYDRNEVNDLEDFFLRSIRATAVEAPQNVDDMLRTMRMVASQNPNFFQDMVNATRSRQRHRLTIDIDVLWDSGNRILPEIFFGPMFDPKDKRPILRGDSPLYRNDYFFYDSEETEEFRVDLSQRDTYDLYNDDYATRGFANVFFEPPYYLRNSTKLSKGEHFLRFCEDMFADPEQIVVYQWSTDCSNYFDDGKEWWGSHFWTVYNQKKDWYVGIVASATD
jgi:hypothetical protein